LPAWWQWTEQLLLHKSREDSPLPGQLTGGQGQWTVASQLTTQV